MGFKFAIGNVVTVPVKFNANDAGKDLKLSVSLTCKRLPGEELKDLLEADRPIKEFLLDVTTGWKDQDFLVDEDTNEPAAFSRDNLSALLEFPGLANLAFAAYLRESAAKAKN